ncbi:MAG: glycoside hydrolase family 31 protein [Candidatus Izemoplasmatales bacterium]|nr:glycoside hydrolase family 31 protein [Candidatus Izemoplasmatales bacterium]
MRSVNFPFSSKGKAKPDMTIEVGNYRFSILTTRLIRIEYSATQQFLDQPTQTVWSRDFQVVPYQVTEESSRTTIETEDIVLLCTNPTIYSKSSGFITLKSSEVTWYFGEECPNLFGTARTLDLISGSTPLKNGVISQSGIAILDDSKSLPLNVSGRVDPITHTRIDLYCFAYGHDYLAAVRDYYHLSGALPLIPRYAFGNWWSKYWPYRDRDLLEVIHQFHQLNIPLSVLVIDMDWHITEIEGVQDYWQGWTGYTVNNKLFPDFLGLIKQLHILGLKVSLNLHPSGGLKPYEDRYREFAINLGMDPEQEIPIPFDPTNPRFMENYFHLLLHPYEENGVDLWWIDWQQGTQTLIPGLDPLWVLNHSHFLDSSKNQAKRPFTFSRWTDRGGQRYPIGFSGDTVISWKSLAYQPYFTATAANIGFTVWSHDIGGHDDGIEDPELFCRWVQFGLFSPIFRLHSARNQFTTREPWRHSTEIRTIVQEAMQFRHQLIPYLYTAYYRNHSLGIPALRPIYYLDPEAKEAYLHTNAYLFGECLYIDPIVSPRDPLTKRSRISTWIPEGEWIDFMTNEVFVGKKTVTRYHPLSNQNVYVKAGGIIPLVDSLNSHADENPQQILIHVYSQLSGSMVLYEDDGISQQYLSGDCFQTHFTLKVSDTSITFEIDPDSQEKPYIPPQRTYRIFFHNVESVTPLFNAIVHDHASEISVKLSSYEKYLLAYEYRKIPNNRAILRSLESFLIDVPLSPILKQAIYDAFLQESNKKAIRASYQKAPKKIQAVLNQFLARFNPSEKQR